MDVVFASSNAHLPQTFGGVEQNTHELAIELNKRGHNVQVLTTLSPIDFFGLKRNAYLKLSRRKVWTDTDLGYVVHRARQPWTKIDDLPRYQVAIMTNGDMKDFAAGFRKVGTKNIAYLHGVTEFLGWDRKIVLGPDALFDGVWAFSEFTAQRFHQSFPIDTPVIRPIFKEERYKTPVDGRYVTFINPVPLKGVERALEIAELCPEIPFVFIRGWALGYRGLKRLKARLSKLPNVQLKDSTNDIRTIHRNSKILLAPTSLQWEETWGRVVTEAQISGIPVIASNHGALPESVGTGGVLIDYDKPAKVWAEEVRKLWRDDAYHSKMSQAALAFSKRKELNISAQLDQFEAALQELVRGR